ncbi:probable G-protein coupled receptor frpr-1 [Physella acuta]|uniref:probable G-protein coupled receptor frpr-1 n=1 Tax=Physella acuta TaxID=109671 RepID=UPI0027DB2A8A|nr:probable G-protein coupled receptor frpr-1 [Physella acuta]
MQDPDGVHQRNYSSTAGVEDDVLTTVQLVSDETTKLIMRVLMYGVTPTISIFGIIGNIFTVLVLRRHGFRKCSNIALVSLAVSDVTFLIGFNSVPKLLYEIGSSLDVFTYSQGVSYVLFVLYQIFHIMGYASAGVSLCIPVLITFERLIAVFLPLYFRLVVTPRRTWAVVVCLVVFWYGFFIHTSFYSTFDYRFSLELNLTVGVIQRSAYHYSNVKTVFILEETWSLLMIKIPLLLTFIGCLGIGIKIKLASIKRTHMTNSSSSEASSNRTTKMLLAVCTLYTCTCAILSLPTYEPQYFYYTMTTDAPSNLGTILYQVINIVLCINSSCNFIIYVVMNKNFRLTFRALFLNLSGDAKMNL